ncbi:hypothetical protein KI387_035112 [Taxus chinensis]|uniref:Uncharacterized protein n=1 Tax=Taxus chinensis TaxID=29808 RepID=A0AA38F6R0_TAXCH|nr:hypothetical protein KI387_035112 [Taxus chinensis]
MESPQASATSAQGARGPAIGARFVPRPPRRRYTQRPKGRACAAATARADALPEPSGGPAHTVPHPTGEHRRPPSASLPTISSTL